MILVFGGLPRTRFPRICWRPRKRTRPSSTCSPTGRRSRPTKPKSPLNGDDPAYHLTDLDALVRTAPRYNLQVMITISGTPKWANGGQTPNDPPTNLNNLTQFAHMLAARYNGLHAGFGSVSRWTVWNEPNLRAVPDAAVRRRRQDRQPARPTRSSTWPPTRASRPATRSPLVAVGRTSNRGRNKPTGDERLASRRPRSRACWSRSPTRSCRSPPGRPTRIRRTTRLGPERRSVSYPNVTMTRLDQFGEVARAVVPPPRADLGHRVRRSRPSRSTPLGGVVTRSRRPTRRPRSTWRRRTRTSRCSSGSSSGHTDETWNSGLVAKSGTRSRRTPCSRSREGRSTASAQIVAGHVPDDPARRPVPHLRQRGRRDGRHHLPCLRRARSGRGRPAGGDDRRPTRRSRFVAKFKPVKGKTYIADADRERQARPDDAALDLADGCA